MKSAFFAGLAIFILIVIGQANAKIGTMIAAIILLATIVLNVENFKKVMKGDFPK